MLIRSYACRAEAAKEPWRRSTRDVFSIDRPEPGGLHDFGPVLCVRAQEAANGTRPRSQDAAMSDLQDTVPERVDR